MGSNQETVSFNEIIQNARQRRKNQSLADQFFSKDRRASAPGSGSLNSKQSQSPGGSLASRVGVGKRSSSSTLRKPNRSSNSRRAQEDRMLSAISSDESKANAPTSNRQSGFNIKGKASGPCVVIGSNFAPGTTAADIESALEPVGGQMLNCMVLASYPAVVAEMTFADNRGAENVVSTFNNQKADGRVLHVRIKPDPASQDLTTQEANGRSQSSFNNMRERADRERRETRRPDSHIQDGRYGFGNNERGNRDVLARDNYGSRRGGKNAFGRGQNANSGNGELYSDRMAVDEPNSGPRHRTHRNR